MMIASCWLLNLQVIFLLRTQPKSPLTLQPLLQELVPKALEANRSDLCDIGKVVELCLDCLFIRFLIHQNLSDFIVSS